MLLMLTDMRDFDVWLAGFRPSIADYKYYVDFIFYNRAIRVGFVHWACYLGWNSYNLFFYQTKKNKLKTQNYFRKGEIEKKEKLLNKNEI